MTQILAYSIISGIFLAAGYVAYMLLLSRQKACTANRTYLLVIYAAALCAYPIKTLYTAVQTSAALPDVSIGNLSFVGTIISASEQPGVSLPTILAGIYAAGAIAVAVWSIAGYINLLRIIRSGQKSHIYGNHTVVVVDRCVVPFSFGKYIVIGRDPENETAMILAHEAAHLSQLHWADLLMAQCVCVVMWYNPAAWLMRAELRRVHEYSADHAVISAGHDTAEYQNLLIKKATGTRLQSLANSLNHSNIYKRITMMYKKSPSGAGRLRALGLIPALVAAAAVCSTPSVVSAMDAAATTAVPTSKVTQKNPVSDAPAAIRVMPSYPGGEPAMIKFLIENFRYPEAAAKANQEGRVVVGFTVEPDGSISDIEVIKSVSPDLDNEAMRIVKSMPAWNPGINEDGKPVACCFTLPINFKLEKDTKTAD